MSITLGVYDLFSYIVPGILYIYILNEFLTLFGFSHLELQNFDSIPILILIAIVSYILGQMMDLVADKWRRWHQNKEGTVDAIERLKKDHPESKINFLPQDAPFLFSLIRRDSPEFASTIERNKALSKMLQNISLGLLLYTFFQLASFAYNNFSIIHFLIAILGFISALLAKRKSQLYNRWFYSHIYEIALAYGNDINHIIKRVQSDKLTNRKQPG